MQGREVTVEDGFEALFMRSSFEREYVPEDPRTGRQRETCPYPDRARQNALHAGPRMQRRFARDADIQRHSLGDHQRLLGRSNARIRKANGKQSDPNPQQLP
jgi:hypothetical protein